MSHAIFILFFFALGACIGSFLNVVVWRLPRGQSLVHPPSHCPKCEHRLAWYDNFPVFGWILLRGRCRYCAQPISARYPTIEFITGALFVFYYVMFFILHISPCAPQKIIADIDPAGRILMVNQLMSSIQQDWPMYLLYMFMISGLLAASLIDAELFIIPLQIPWLLAIVGIVVHAIVDRPSVPGALNVPPDGLAAALAAGGAAGLVISMLLYFLGRMPQSFSEGEPALEVDEAIFQGEVERCRRENLPEPQRPRQYTRPEIRREIRKEMLFLLPPLICSLLAAGAVHYIQPLNAAWKQAMAYHWFSGVLGALLGALVGALVVWLARILGTLAFGRVAMGLGDVHLMFGVGAIVGAGAATVAFFLAPFAGLAVGLYGLITRRQRELPYGPYLSLATAAVLLVYCPIADYLGPGLAGMSLALRSLLGVG